MSTTNHQSNDSQTAREVNPAVLICVIVIALCFLYGLVKSAETIYFGNFFKEEPTLSQLYRENNTVNSMAFTELDFSWTGNAIFESPLCGEFNISANIGQTSEGVYFAWKLSDPEAGTISISTGMQGLFTKDDGVKAFTSALALVEKNCKDSLTKKSIKAQNERTWASANDATP